MENSNSFELFAKLFTWLVALVQILISWIIRGLKENDKSLFNKTDNLNTRLSTLEGRCEANHRRK